MAQIDGTGTLVASTWPLRSRMRPRLAGTSITWRVALLALLLVEVGADDLDVDRPPDQHGEGQADQHHHEARAPRRRLRSPAAGWWRSSGCARWWRRRAWASCGCGSWGRAPRAGVAAAGPSTTYCVTAGVAVRMRSFSRATFSTRKCVAWAWRSASRRLNSVSSWRLLDARTVERMEQAARLVRGLHQVQATGQQGGKQQQVHARHPCSPPRPRRCAGVALAYGTAVRSATRSTAERARGLAATSAAPARMRPSARSRDGRGGANGRAPVGLVAAFARDEALDDAVLERMEADHDQASCGASSSSAALSPCSSSSSSALT